MTLYAKFYSTVKRVSFYYVPEVKNTVYNCWKVGQIDILSIVIDKCDVPDMVNNITKHIITISTGKFRHTVYFLWSSTIHPVYHDSIFYSE